MAALFHRMRIFLNCPVVIKTFGSFSFFTFKSIIIVGFISDRLRIGPKPDKAAISPSESRVLSRSPPPLSQTVSIVTIRPIFLKDFYFMWLLNDFPRRFLSTTCHLPFISASGRSQKGARLRLHSAEIIDPMATFKRQIYANKRRIDNNNDC